jgi:hypothetical protein
MINITIKWKIIAVLLALGSVEASMDPQERLYSFTVNEKPPKYVSPPEYCHLPTYTESSNLADRLSYFLNRNNFRDIRNIPIIDEEALENLVTTFFDAGVCNIKPPCEDNFFRLILLVLKYDWEANFSPISNLWAIKSLVRIAIHLPGNFEQKNEYFLKALVLTRKIGRPDIYKKIRERQDSFRVDFSAQRKREERDERDLRSYITATNEKISRLFETFENSPDILVRFMSMEDALTEFRRQNRVQDYYEYNSFMDVFLNQLSSEQQIELFRSVLTLFTPLFLEAKDSRDVWRVLWIHKKIWEMCKSAEFIHETQAELFKTSVAIIPENEIDANIFLEYVFTKRAFENNHFPFIGEWLSSCDD